MGLIDLKDAILSVQDGSTNYLELHIGEGNFQWSEKRNVEFVKTRGSLAFTRQGEDEPIEISFEFLWDFVTSSGEDPVTIHDALTKQGNATTWTSSTGDPLQPYSVNLVIVYTPPCPGVLKETLIFQNFYYEEMAYSPKDAAIAVKGHANITKVAANRG